MPGRSEQHHHRRHGCQPCRRHHHAGSSALFLILPFPFPRFPLCKHPPDLEAKAKAVAAVLGAPVKAIRQGVEGSGFWQLEDPRGDLERRTVPREPRRPWTAARPSREGLQPYAVKPEVAAAILTFAGPN